MTGFEGSGVFDSNGIFADCRSVWGRPVISGVIADVLGMRTAIQVVAALTLLSGLPVAFRNARDSSGSKAEAGEHSHIRDASVRC